MSTVVSWLRESFNPPPANAHTSDTGIRLQYAIVPILAQRLMINMRRVDYLGSAPLASTLLFAPQEESDGSDDSIENGASAGPVEVSQWHTPRGIQLTRRVNSSGRGEHIDEAV